MHVFNLAQEIHRSSLFNMRGDLLFSLVYWKELLQQLLRLLLQMFIPKPELRDQETSRKLRLYLLARALGSVSKTHFEGVPFGPAGPICSTQQEEHAT